MFNEPLLFTQSRAYPLSLSTNTDSSLDVHNVMHVINFDLPSNDHGGIEEYTHRIGKHILLQLNLAAG